MDEILKRKNEVETKFLSLSDGRTVSYLDIGDPDGTPIFYFHGSPGSRFEVLFSEESALKRKLRLIAPDRPGFGDSDFKKAYALLDYNKDILEIAEHLGLTKFGVVGVSGGGTTVLALAYEHSDKLLFAVDICGWPPIHKTNLAKYMAPLDRFFSKIAKISPRLFKLPFSYIGRVAKTKPPEKFSKLIRSSMSKADLEVIKNKEIEMFLAENTKESFRKGSEGPSWDAILRYLDWGFKLQDINSKIHLFYGTDDKFVPLEFSEYKKITLPNVEYFEFKDEGHLNLLTKFDEIISKVL